MLEIDNARLVIAQFVDSYNTKRLHSAIYFLTPEDTLNGHMQERLRVRDEKLLRVREVRHKTRQAA